MAYRLLTRFENIFRDGPYLHRNSSLGDSIAVEWYDDMYALGLSPEFNERASGGSLVVNTQNRITGKASRRGDGTLGDGVPGVPPVRMPEYLVARGPTATLRIGVEVKILAKAMIKQIDRVINDLEKQAREFDNLSPRALKVALIGLNWSERYVSYERDRSFCAERPPRSEAGEARRRILERVASRFDEVVFLEFKATNEQPFDFEWLNAAGVERAYAAALLRVSQKFINT